MKRILIALAVAITATFTGREFYKITKDLLEMPEVKSLYK